jgi:hypothetical protein
MKAREFDKKFDEGRDISQQLDISKARRPEQEQKRVNVDFPVWMIQLLDKEARRLGVPRQSIIKVWVAERLEKVSWIYRLPTGGERKWRVFPNGAAGRFW